MADQMMDKSHNLNMILVLVKKERWRVFPLEFKVDNGTYVMSEKKYIETQRKKRAVITTKQTVTS